jgi:hypothetical protein
MKTCAICGKPAIKSIHLISSYSGKDGAPQRTEGIFHSCAEHSNLIMKMEASDITRSGAPPIPEPLSSTRNETLELFAPQNGHGSI